MVNLVHDVRQEIPMTQQQLADILSVSTTTVARCEQKGVIPQGEAKRLLYQLAEIGKDPEKRALIQDLMNRNEGVKAIKALLTIGALGSMLGLAAYTVFNVLNDRLEHK